MSLVEILSVFNYGLVFLFGMALSVSIAGGGWSRREWTLLLALCPIFLVPQAAVFLIWGLDAAKRFYPLLVHLPLLLMLVLGLKKPPGISLVSVCTAYLCCQFPRCIGVIAIDLTGSALAGELVYFASIALTFFFLIRYFVPSARDAMTESRKALRLFGIVPVFYYVYDYTIAARINLHYAEILSPGAAYSAGEVAAELLPTVIGLLYMVYVAAYRQQLRRQTEAELRSSMMASQLKQAEAEMAALRQAETLAATYQHDTRHHLNAIEAFLSAGQPQQAEAYIRRVQADIEAITPKRFCENELVNLLCSSFEARAARLEVPLTLEAAVPAKVGISDTELCALLSNGLENALRAAAGLEDRARRQVTFRCVVRLGKLLVEIRNPYAGAVTLRDGLPWSDRPGHGRGCRSIQTIVENHSGLCEFRAEAGVFTLRAALPI